MLKRLTSSISSKTDMTLLRLEILQWRIVCETSIPIFLHNAPNKLIPDRYWGWISFGVQKKIKYILQLAHNIQSVDVTTTNQPTNRAEIGLYLPQNGQKWPFYISEILMTQAFQVKWWIPYPGSRLPCCVFRFVYLHSRRWEPSISGGTFKTVLQRQK